MITIKTRPMADPIKMPADDIPAGTAFTGKIAFYEDRLFVKVYKSVVSLNDLRGGIWNDVGDDLVIENYQPVNITITVDGPADA